MIRRPARCHRCGSPATIRLRGPESHPLCPECSGISPELTLAELAERYPGAWPIIAGLDDYVWDMVAIRRLN